jgi:iron complex transport system permease protein
MATEIEDVETDLASGWRTLVSGRLLWLAVASTALAVVAGLVQVRYGTYTMTFGEAWRAVTNPRIVLDPVVWQYFVFGGELNLGALFDPGSWDRLILETEFPDVSREALVVWTMRLPRVLIAAVVGSTLAVSGAIFQGVTRNELASPFVLGVSSGAGFVVLLTLVIYSALEPLLPLLAALGGAVAFVLVYLIAWQGGTSPVRLVLAGVIVNMVFQSLQRGLFFFADDLGTVQSALSWITGSLTGTGWSEFRLIFIPSMIVLAISMLGARHLNVLLLGEDTARSLGMQVERARFLLAAVAILAASVSIVAAGVIGFFGLVVPHLVRLSVGSDYRRLLVGSVFVGAALMILADVGARLGLFLIGGAMGQIPVGIVTGLIGGPYFLYLMRRRTDMGDL